VSTKPENCPIPIKGGRNMSEFQTSVDGYEEENTKFETGNKAAGKRARKWLMVLITAAKNRRKEIQDVKNAG
jgi:hypothetical protein